MVVSTNHTGLKITCKVSRNMSKTYSTQNTQTKWCHSGRKNEQNPHWNCLFHVSWCTTTSQIVGRSSFTCCDGLWSIVNSTETPPDLSEAEKCHICSEMRLCTGSHRVVCWDLTAISDWRSLGSHHCVEETDQSIPKENVGKQTGIKTQTILTAIERRWLCAGTHYDYGRSFEGLSMVGVPVSEEDRVI